MKEAMHIVMQQPGAQKRYRQRQAMVEPVYAELKHIQGLLRFRRMGLAAVRLEFYLHACAHNLRRAAAVSAAVAACLIFWILRAHMSPQVTWPNLGSCHTKLA